MRVTLASLLTTFVAVFIMVAGATAATVHPKGTVVDSSNNPVEGASVTITCNSTVLNVTTNADGEYSSTFANGLCDPADTVFVQVEFNGETGSTSSPAGTGNLPLPLIVLSAVAVPEFGLITGIVAAGGSALAYLKMRKGMV